MLHLAENVHLAEDRRSRQQVAAWPPRRCGPHLRGAPTWRPCLDGGVGSAPDATTDHHGIGARSEHMLDLAGDGLASTAVVRCHHPLLADPPHHRRISMAPASSAPQLDDAVQWWRHQSEFRSPRGSRRWQCYRRWGLGDGQELGNGRRATCPHDPFHRVAHPVLHSPLSSASLQNIAYQRAHSIASLKKLGNVRRLGACLVATASF